MISSKLAGLFLSISVINVSAYLEAHLPDDSRFYQADKTNHHTDETRNQVQDISLDPDVPHTGVYP